MPKLVLLDTDTFLTDGVIRAIESRFTCLYYGSHTTGLAGVVAGVWTGGAAGVVAGGTNTDEVHVWLAAVRRRAELRHIHTGQY